MPIMLKAAFGGGGRGMRVVRSADELPRRSVAPRRRRSRRLATGRCSSSGTSSRRGTSRSRSWRTARARRPPLRARLLRPAPPPEGGRGRAGDRPGRRRDARRSTRTRCASRSGAGYRNAGTVEFLVDKQWPPLLHRGQPAHPGGAHRHRGHHRRRPRAVADPHRGRAAPRGHRPLAGQHLEARLRHPGARDDRGPRSSTSARHGAPPGLAPRRGAWHPPRRRNAYPGATISPHYDSMLMKVTRRRRTSRRRRTRCRAR